MDYRIHESLNVKYSKEIWNICSSQKIPLIYASSAATYGMGEHGYKDDHDVVLKLHLSTHMEIQKIILTNGS